MGVLMTGLDAPVDIHRAWERFRTAGDQRARTTLIEFYMPEVDGVLRQFRNVRPSDREDLRGAGYYGLCRAVDEWDPDRMPWLRFARWKIKYAMVDQIRASSWVPKGVRARAAKIEAAEEELALRLGREPTSEELAEHLGLVPEELEVQIASFRATDWAMVSLDHRAETELPWIDTVADPGAEDPSDTVERYEELAGLELILQRLPGRDRLVIRWAFFHWPRMPQKVIAQRLGVHESRVSQILTQALERARRLVGQPCLFEKEIYAEGERFTRRL